MFGTTPNDLAHTLSQMERTARERSNFNQNAARELMAEYLSHDARFSEYDPRALIDRVMACKSNGAVLDLDDPRLKGRERRPLDW